MLGWEFPPFISGGLGTACSGLTRGLSRMGTEILFVLPRPVPASHTSHVRLLWPGSKAHSMAGPRPGGFENVRFRALPVELAPYHRPDDEKGRQARSSSRKDNPRSHEAPGGHYTGNLLEEVERYAELVCELAQDQDFDVVHAHDWMTYPAGIAVALLRQKPLTVHVHSTEFDRSGMHVNQQIYDIERRGMHEAAMVIAVSKLTRHVINSRYGVAPEKVQVVYNAIDADPSPGGHLGPPPGIERHGRNVLFLGRMTMQKGPEYFLAAARRVLEVMGDVRFVMAGSGDRMGRTMDLAAELGLRERVIFTGFLRGAEVDRVFRTADLFVMPSVSEPFGLVALEAISHGVPVIVSNQSGVAEILDHALKVNFWDVEDMAGKIIAVLREPSLRAALRADAWQELSKLSWDESARRCLRVYEALVPR